MKIQTAQIFGANRTQVKPGTQGGVPGSSPRKTQFSDLMEKLRGGSGDAHAELVGFRDKILSGKQFSHQELLYFQVRAGELGMKVELCSKLAESLSSTLKKFQQSQ